MSYLRTSASQVPPAALGLLLALTVLTACHKTVPAPPHKTVAGSVAGKTNAPALANTNLALEFTSVFDDSLPLVNTRDPFYPDSTRLNSINPAAPAQPQAPKEVVLKLFSIAGSPIRRVAVINNEILEVGDESDIKTADGKVHVKVLEIGEDYVVLTVRGESGQKRLTLPKESLNPTKEKKP